MAVAAAHDNWAQRQRRRPLDVVNVRPTDSPDQLKYIGQLMADQLAENNVETLQDLLDILSASPDQASVQGWLETVLTNGRPYYCVGLAQPARNHGQPFRYHVPLVNKFAYNAMVTWLNHWWTDPNTRYYLGPPLAPGVRGPRRLLDKVPPPRTDRTAQIAFPPICAPPIAPPAPARGPPPPHPPGDEGPDDENGDDGENGGIRILSPSPPQSPLNFDSSDYDNDNDDGVEPLPPSPRRLSSLELRRLRDEALRAELRRGPSYPPWPPPIPLEGRNEAPPPPIRRALRVVAFRPPIWPPSRAAEFPRRSSRIRNLEGRAAIIRRASRIRKNVLRPRKGGLAYFPGFYRIYF